MKIKEYTLIGVIILFLVGLIIYGPIPQDQDYHKFIDDNNILGIENFNNVVSNIFFLFFGVWGLIQLRRNRIIESLKTYYIIFCLSVVLTAFGSSYYHYDPNNFTLVWDRLPMTISFISLFCAVIGEYINPRLGREMLFPLLVFGVISVIYWYISEQLGSSDLRLYVIVQYLPLILIPLILFMYKPINTERWFLFWALLFYIISKIFELLDKIIFKWSDFIVSGHTIKHMFAAIASLWVMKIFFKDKTVNN